MEEKYYRKWGGALALWVVACGFYWSHTDTLIEMPEYFRDAIELASTGRISQNFAPNGYSLFLAASIGVFGESYFWVGQALILAIAIAVVAGLLDEYWYLTSFVAINPYAIINVKRVNDNAINYVLVILAFCAAVALYRRRYTPVVAFGILGGSIGYFVMSRPNALAVAPLMVLPCVLWYGKRPCRETAVGLAVFASIIVLVSWLSSSRLLYFPSNGPYNLLAGANNFTEQYLLENLNAEYSIGAQLKSEGLSVSQRDLSPTECRERALTFIKNNSGQMAWLSFVKLVTLLRPDWSNSKGLVSRTVHAVLALPIPLWLFLAIKYGRRRSAVVGLCLFAYAMPFVLTNSDPRFRLPMDVVATLDAILILAAILKLRSEPAKALVLNKEP